VLVLQLTGINCPGAGIFCGRGLKVASVGAGKNYSETPILPMFRIVIYLSDSCRMRELEKIGGHRARKIL